MAYQSRANTCRANTTYLGLYEPEIYVEVGGVDVVASRALIKDSFSITHSRTEQTCSFALRNTETEPGQEVIVRDGGAAGRLVFCGNVAKTSSTFHRSRDGVIVYDAIVADSVWLLDRYDLVNASYSNLSASTMVAQILASFTDGGWNVGIIDGSLGPLTMQFSYARVSNAIRRIAAAVGGIITVDCAMRTVSIVTEYTDGHATLIDGDNADYFDLKTSFSRDQSRNRTIVEGDGSTLDGAIAASVASIVVKDPNPFSGSGGLARVGATTFTYTGKTGNVITGASGGPAAADGAAINVISVASTTTDQTSLAAVLGGGLSGQITHFIQDRRIGADAAALRAAQDVTIYGKPTPTLGFTTRSRFVHPAKTVTVSLTAPRALSGTFTMDTIRIEPQRGKRFVGSSPLRLHYSVDASPGKITLQDLLEQINSEA